MKKRVEDLKVGENVVLETHAGGVLHAQVVKPYAEKITAVVYGCEMRVHLASGAEFEVEESS